MVYCEIPVRVNSLNSGFIYRRGFRKKADLRVKICYKIPAERLPFCKPSKVRNLPDSVLIKRPARRDCIHECLEILIEFARSHGFAAPDVHKLRLVAEEVLANIVAYAYREKPGDVEMFCRMEAAGPDGTALLMEFRDSGIPFRFEAPEPDFAANIDDRPIGGLGIYLVRALALDVSYRRENGQNILCVTIGKRASRPEVAFHENAAGQT